MKLRKHLFRFIALLAIFWVFTIVISAQDTEEEQDPPTRSIISKDFKAKRAKKKRAVNGRKKARKRTRRQRRRKRITTNAQRRYKYTRRKNYRRKKKRVARKKRVKKALKYNYINEELGVTFWRLRPLKAFEKNDGDVTKFRVLTDRQSGRREQWTAERVNSTNEFVKGDRVRFSIESSRTGYLYIINREFYLDGTYGNPSLIFPTLRTRSGNNQVRAGSLIEIPGPTDSVPYFKVTPKRENYAGEELVVIITRKPIPGIKTTLRAQKITPAKIEKWLQDWGSIVDTYDAEDGVGIVQTAAETLAANIASRDLTQEEPLPQTIYRVKVREDLPIVIPFQMKTVRP